MAQEIDHGQYAIFETDDPGLIGEKDGQLFALTPEGEPIHHLVAERMLGRRLAPNERVVHLNGNTLDNRRANLRVVQVANGVA